MGHGSVFVLVNGSWVTACDPLPALPEVQSGWVYGCLDAERKSWHMTTDICGTYWSLQWVELLRKRPGYSNSRYIITRLVVMPDLSFLSNVHYVVSNRPILPSLSLSLSSNLSFSLLQAVNPSDERSATWFLLLQWSPSSTSTGVRFRLMRSCETVSVMSE